MAQKYQDFVYLKSLIYRRNYSSSRLKLKTFFTNNFVRCPTKAQTKTKAYLKKNITANFFIAFWRLILFYF